MRPMTPAEYRGQLLLAVAGAVALFGNFFTITICVLAFSADVSAFVDYQRQRFSDRIET